MGVEFRLVKTRTGRTYDLGKAAMRPPVDDWETRIKGLSPLRDALAWQEAMHPSDRAMWLIGSTGSDCEASVMSGRWTPETLADVMQTAVLQEDDPTLARRIADDVLAWAGDDQVVLIPDGLDEQEVLERFGRPRRMRIERTLDDVVSG
jgi:hypothetical protein